MKILTPYILIIAIVIIALYAVGNMHKKCRSEGGIPIGYYGSDCWDNINKTFIK